MTILFFKDGKGKALDFTLIKEDQNTYLVIAIMSGTSLDGIDVAYIQFDTYPSWSFTFLNTETINYSQDWKNKLQFKTQIDPIHLKELDQNYGQFLGNIIEDFKTKNKIKNNQIDLIASHGHTLFHKPEIGYTKQIGNGPEIFQNQQIPVVCDFRVQDVALGGQGAPLVPIGDQKLFPQFDACINLGGFANISFEKDKDRLAMDICPVNFVSNKLVSPLGISYDNEGQIAQSGKINSSMLRALNNLDYYKKHGPKTLGAEWVETNIDPILIDFNLDLKDSLRTFSEHVSDQISTILNGNKTKKALFTGGGVYNSFLMELIRSKTSCQIQIPDRELIEFKEALIFGLLGILKIKGKVNVLSSVTGARQNHSSGKIYI